MNMTFTNCYKLYVYTYSTIKYLNRLSLHLIAEISPSNIQYSDQINVSTNIHSSCNIISLFCKFQTVMGCFHA